MATGTVVLPIPGAFDATNPPGLVPENSIMHVAFDDTTAQSMRWRFRMPENYASAPVLKLQYSMASATTGTVELDASLWAATTGEDVDTESYDTVNVGTETVPGTAGLSGEISVTLTNADSLAAGDLVALLVTRDATDVTNDTATGDLELRAVSLEYTTT